MLEFLAEHGAALLFYLFAAITVAGAIGVVTLRNPMYGAISLLASFLSVAALFVLRHAEFLAVVQIFVYGGGIMVLFLFVIMLVNLHRLPEPRGFMKNAIPAIVVVLALAVTLGFFFVDVDLGPQGDVSAFDHAEGEKVGNTEAVALTLYRQYLVPFEIASVFLLVAMIGAVILGRRQ